MANNYYTSQFQKIGINDANGNSFKDKNIKIKLSSDMGESNFINIDFITFMQIYNALISQNDRERNA